MPPSTPPSRLPLSDDDFSQQLSVMSHQIAAGRHELDDAIDYISRKVAARTGMRPFSSLEEAA